MTTIPKSADLVRWHAGTVERGPHKGKRVEEKLFEGRASRGYQTDYERVPHRWVLVRIGEDFEKVHQFSGRNYEDAMRYYEDGLRVTDDEGRPYVELEAVRADLA